MKVAVLVALGLVCAVVEAKSVEKRGILDDLRGYAEAGFKHVSDFVSKAVDKTEDLWGQLKERISGVDTDEVREKVQDKLQDVKDRVSDSVIGDVIESVKDDVSRAKEFLSAEEIAAEIRPSYSRDAVSDEDLLIIVDTFEDAAVV